MRKRVIAAAAIVAAAAVTAGLALGESRHGVAAGLPACATARAAVAPPAGLAAFPLPAGAVLDGRRAQYGYTIVSGLVPGAINPVRDFLVSRAPQAGYRVLGGDAEASEAEASFSGHGGRGRWKVRELPGCPGALRVEIAFRG
jgi:hypothetical protein